MLQNFRLWAKFHSKPVVFDLKLTQNLKTHSKIWKLTQIFGEQFQWIEVVVTSKVADNLDMKGLVSWCSTANIRCWEVWFGIWLSNTTEKFENSLKNLRTFKFFSGVWAKSQIPPLRSVIFAIKHFLTPSLILFCYGIFLLENCYKLLHLNLCQKHHRALYNDKMMIWWSSYEKKLLEWWLQKIIYL